MKNKLGFTLIELLAVIIILAIVALIATPIVLDVIDDARISAGKSEANMILGGINNYCANEEMKAQLDPNYTRICTSDKDKDDVPTMVNLGNATIDKIVYNGDKLTELEITSNNHKFTLCPSGTFAMDEESCQEPEEICQIILGNGYNLGDQISCAGEDFYVFGNDGNNIFMIAKYNLNVGEFLYPDADVGVQNVNVAGAKFISSETELDTFIVDETYTPYGAVPFSSTKYWEESNVEFDYVYNNESNVYKYINDYEKYLIENGVLSAKAKLLDYNFLEEISNSVFEENFSSQYDEEYLLGLLSSIMGSNAPSFWYGNAANGGNQVFTSSTLGFVIKDVDNNYLHNNLFGVRPFVTISISEI